MKYKMVLLTILVLSLVLIAACTQQNTIQQPPDNQNQQTTGTVNQQNTPIIGKNETVSSNPNPVQQVQVKEFTMTAKQWEFVPSVITVNKGDKVKLIIKSIDVTHGFALPDFGVSKNLEPGKEVTVEFTADKTGEFTFFCNVICGAGHREMKGTLKVL